MSSNMERTARRTVDVFRYEKIPAPTTSFIGRREELLAVHSLLDKNRLVTIVGMGGIGKTRLAVHLAQERVQRMRHGVCYVSLAASTTLEMMIGAISEQLSFSFHGHEEAAEQLASFLQDKALLLVLDNFEQLTQFASFFETLLIQAPELHLLFTSRTRLNLYGETVHHLDGLTYLEEADSRTIDDSDS